MAGYATFRWIEREKAEFSRYWQAAEKQQVPKTIPPLDSYAMEQAYKRRRRFMRADMSLSRYEAFTRQEQENKKVCFALFDEDGYLLKLFGNSELTAELRSRGIDFGSIWSLGQVGPNAVSIGLREKRSMACTAANNWSDACRGLDLYFMPTRDERTMLDIPALAQQDTEPLLGGLALFAVAGSSPEACQMVLQTLYYMLHLHLYFLHRNFEDNQLNRRWVLTIDTSIKPGEMIFSTSDEENYTYLFNFFGIPPIDLYMQPASSLFDPLPKNKRLWEIIQKGINVKEEAITLSIRGRVKTCVLTAAVFNQSAINFGGVALYITTPQRVARQISKKTGNSAVRTFPDIIGCSNPMKAALVRARMMANADSNVLILGESGSGKDVFAQAIHNASRRADKPFVAVNCGALPRDLIASELFGYEGGAFTGAKRQGNMGKFELANGGTLFLDEIGEMPLDLQATLLRAVEQKSITRLGSTKEIEVDVKIISATNANLRDLINEKRFREDLYYRLSTLRLTLPPLRQRGEDIILLAEEFIRAASQRIGRQDLMTISPQARELLLHHSWHGNVRELQNLIEGIVLLYPDPVITAEHILADLHVREDLLPQPAVSSGHGRKAELTRERLLETLAQCGGNRSEAAKLLDISRRTLYRYLERWGIDL